MLKIGQRVIYTQPQRLHTVFMPPATRYEGNIISAYRHLDGSCIYRIKLDLKWGDKDGSYVNKRYANENVILGNVTSNLIKAI